jgi:hypothetical protein
MNLFSYVLGSLYPWAATGLSIRVGPVRLFVLGSACVLVT